MPPPSRSQARRIASQQGKPQPTFGPEPLTVEQVARRIRLNIRILIDTPDEAERYLRDELTTFATTVQQAEREVIRNFINQLLDKEYDKSVDVRMGEAAVTALSAVRSFIYHRGTREG